jgi:hypothetical protein
VILVENDVLLCEGLASLLERSEFEVVAQAGDAVRLLKLVRDRTPVSEPDDNVDLARKPTAELSATKSAKSCPEWVAISITVTARRSASSKPLSAPRSTSIRATSGRECV